MISNILSALKPNHWRDLYRDFRNYHYEYDDDNNLLISTVKLAGSYETLAPDGLGAIKTSNLITTEGANHLLSVGVAGGSQVGTWYVGIFSGNVSVTDALTAATFASATTELTTQYSESTRVAYVEAAPAAKSVNNTSNPSVFTAAATNVNIWGVGLLSSSTKGGTTGTLLSVSKYPSVRTLPSIGDTIAIRYVLTLSNS